MRIARTLRHVARLLPWAFGLLVVFGGTLSANAQGRYIAIFPDGKRAESDKFDTWPLGLDAAFRRAPLEAAQTPRTVIDRQNPANRVGPYIELANGDVLPGRIVGYSDDARRLPPQFKVALEGVLQGGNSNTISIHAAAVARIVGAKEPALSQDVAGVLLADGRKLAPRSQRWTSTGLRMLTEQGVSDAPFADLADVVLAGIDRTTATLSDSQRALQTSGDRLFHLMTRDGAALTTSFASRYTQREQFRGRERFRPPVRIPRTYLSVQPAWSFDTLNLLEESVSVFGVRPPSEIPLSALSAKTLVERNLLGIAHPWRRDRAVRGGALESGELASDLGLGMHSHCEVSFELPAGSKEFSAWVGLDRIVGLGGCVECKVYLDSLSGEPAWQIDFLRGGEEPSRVGPIDVRSAERLVLVVEYGHDDRPNNADPLDIRDEVVWLAPLVTVDLAASDKRRVNTAPAR